MRARPGHLMSLLLLLRQGDDGTLVLDKILPGRLLNIVRGDRGIHFEQLVYRLRSPAKTHEGRDVGGNSLRVIEAQREAVSEVRLDGLQSLGLDLRALERV